MPEIRSSYERIQILVQDVFFGGIDRNLQTDVIRIFREGTDIRDNDSASQTQRSQQRSRAFSHRWKAEIQDDVTGRDVTHEVIYRRESEYAHGRLQPKTLDQRLQREVRVR